MVVIREIACSRCGEVKQEMVGPGRKPTMCHKCIVIKQSEDRAIHLKGLEALTVEERLKRIEEWIYDYNPPVSLRDIRM